VLQEIGAEASPLVVYPADPQRPVPPLVEKVELQIREEEGVWIIAITIPKGCRRTV